MVFSTRRCAGVVIQTASINAVVVDFGAYEVRDGLTVFGGIGCESIGTDAIVAQR
jgi:hypothetical protein